MSPAFITLHSYIVSLLTSCFLALEIPKGTIKLGDLWAISSQEGGWQKTIVGFATPEILTWKSILIQFLMLHLKGYLEWAQDNPIGFMYRTTVAEI